MSLFVIFKFPAAPSHVHPDIAGDRTRKTDAGIRRRTLPGTLQEGHRGSAGQGKRRTDPRATPHGKLECSSGLLLLVLKLYPELHLGIPPGRLIKLNWLIY
ncbi:unnamed protein product [Staurois parvus]|uniref:Uncharacterized protein n=1 Tax=Staurois parvus TaxID=386267 RepID=A0ABN9HRT6_9NEOB|nr:unnamed protein product [Staurois parvus]